jgi:GalNAc-alpha-(1->4)-GalNAc-alpha-(1->3)-diNAcBac-PP-undecaprenol alpha-1,4-N-acetyl-D-galactosaminyltransferase
MRVAFNITSLQMGGAERVLSGMADYWCRRGWHVTVVTYDDGLSPPFFDLHPAVERIGMNNAQPYAGLVKALLRNIARVVDLRKAIVSSRPDCVIAMGEVNGARALVAALGLGIPVIVSEHTDYHELAASKNGWIWIFLRRLLYPLAAAVSVLNEPSKSRLGKRVRRKTAVIPNAIPDDLCTNESEPSQIPALPPNTIAAMGRLVPQKRFDLLIEAFQHVAKESDCSLLILGEGPLRGELEGLVENLGLTNRVSMPGAIPKPWDLLRHSRMVVVSSEVESFGLVLVEAMACGVPVVSFDCPNGPRGIIRDGIDGFLVPPLDVSALARAMKKLLTDDDLHKSMSARCREVRARYSQERVMALWDDLVRLVCRGSAASSETPALDA